MVEQLPVKEKVLGSSPSVGAIMGFRLTVGRLPLKERILVRIQVTQPNGRLNVQGTCPLAKRSELNGLGIETSVFRQIISCRLMVGRQVLSLII